MKPTELVVIAERIRAEAEAAGKFKSDAECVSLAAAEIERQKVAARAARPAAAPARSPAPATLNAAAHAFDVTKPSALPGMCVSGGQARFR